MVRKMGGWRKSGGGRAGNFWDAYEVVYLAIKKIEERVNLAVERIIPRKRGFVSYRRVLEQALQLIIEQETRKEVA